MMLLPTKREEELWNMFYKEKDAEKKDKILQELKKIDDEKTKDLPFAH